jgi:hypothetical protein
MNPERYLIILKIELSFSMANQNNGENNSYCGNML